MPAQCIFLAFPGSFSFTLVLVPVSRLQGQVTLDTVCAAKLLHNCAIRMLPLQTSMRAPDPVALKLWVWERVWARWHSCVAAVAVPAPLYSCLQKAPQDSMCATDSLWKGYKTTCIVLSDPA